MLAEFVTRLRDLSHAIRQERRDDCKRIMRDIVMDCSSTDRPYTALFEAAALFGAAASVTGEWPLVVEMYSRVRQHPEHDQAKVWLRQEADLHFGYALLKSGSCEEGIRILEGLIDAQPSRAVLSRLSFMLADIQRERDCARFEGDLRRLLVRVPELRPGRGTGQKVPGERGLKRGPESGTAEG